MKDGVVVRNSLWKLPFFILPCVFLLLVALLGPETFGLRPKAGWELLRWPTVIGMGVVIALFIRQLGDRTPQIVIGRPGIFMRTWSADTIPWDAVRQIRVERQYISGFLFKRHLCLYLYNPDAYPRTTWRARFFSRGSNLGHGDITMMTTGLDHEIEDLWEAIERFAPAEVELDGAQLGGGVGPRRKRG